MSTITSFVSIILGFLVFASGVKLMRAHWTGNLERVTNVLLLVFIIPGVLGAFDSLGTASAQQLLFYISGILGCIGAAFSLSSLPLLRRSVSDNSGLNANDA